MSDLMLEVRPFFEDWIVKYEETNGQIPNYLLHDDLPQVRDKYDRDTITYILFALSNLTQDEYLEILQRFFPNMYYQRYGSQ